MFAPLATVEHIAARSGETIESETELKLAKSMLEAASANVRHYGRNWPSPDKAPAVAVTITVAAATRGYMNPGGLDLERGDAVTLDWSEDYTKGTELTAEERNQLRVYSVRTGVVSVGTYNDTVLRTRSEMGGREWRGYAPTLDGTKPFPLGPDPR